MSNVVIITNTIGKPLFILGKFLAAGASMEVDQAAVPDCLRDSDTDVAATAAEPPEVTQPEPTPPSDEDLLLAAVKAKGK